MLSLSSELGCSDLLVANAPPSPDLSFRGSDSKLDFSCLDGLREENCLDGPREGCLVGVADGCGSGLVSSALAGRWGIMVG